MDQMIKLKANWNSTRGPEKKKTKVEISINKMTTLKFWMTNVDFEGMSEKRK
jgi:hypothetical protein